jgi:hypothetical protein
VNVTDHVQILHSDFTVLDRFQVLSYVASRLQGQVLVTSRLLEHRLPSLFRLEAYCILYYSFHSLTMAYAQPFPLAAPQTKSPQQPSFGPDLAVRLICPECRDPNPNIVEEFGSGDLVCGNCGLVLGDRIVDTRSEWRVSVPSQYF